MDLIKFRLNEDPLDFNLHLSMVVARLHQLENPWPEQNIARLNNLYNELPQDYAHLVEGIANITVGNVDEYFDTLQSNPLIIKELDNFFFRRSTSSTGLYILGVIARHKG